MGSFCCTGYEKPQQRRYYSCNSVEEFGFNAGLFIQANKEVISNVYKLYNRPIGYGSYGEVWLCEHLKSKEMRAVKIVDKSLISLEMKKNNEILLEIEILKELDHPNVLKIFEYFEDKLNYYIIMEYCQHGDLLDELEKRGKFEEAEASKIMCQIISAVNYFHNKDIIHRDLKLENILIWDKQNELHVKIIDFNISTFKNTNKLDKFTGTWLYMAPEVIEQCYNEKCDLWSCGVIMYLLLTGEFPFNGKDREAIMESILKGRIKPLNIPNLSSKGRSFISNLLRKSPSVRFSAEQALRHPWIELFSQPSDNITFQRTLTRMLSIKKRPKIQEIFETFLLSQVQKKQTNVKILEKVFKELDTDKSGTISMLEIFTALKEIMPEESAKKESERLLKLTDNDFSGQIDYTEFLRVAAEEELASKENLVKAFYYFDKNSSGGIDKHELMDWLSQQGDISMKVVEDMIEEADVNRDGVIDFEEFENLLLDRVLTEEDLIFNK